MDWERRLPKLLAAGWSYERIGTMLGRDPETIAGRARRLGLVSAHVARTTPKGPLDAGTLAALLAEGLSIRVIAERTDRSAATVRHWMRHHALEPVGRPGAPRKTAVDEGGAVVAACPTHGETTFVRPVRRRTPLSRLPVGGGEQTAPEGQADPRRGSRRQMRALRVRPLRRRSAVPPPRPRRKALLAVPRWSPAGARDASGRSSEVRATVRELPRRGRAWDHQAR